MVNKPMLLVAMLAMVLLAAAPALTQTAPNDIVTSPELVTDAVQTSEDTAVDPAAVPATEPAAAPASEPTTVPAGVWVGCELLYTPPGDRCAVDANGEIEMPDGSMLPVLISPLGDVFVQHEDGTLTLVGTDTPLITTEVPAASETPATGETQPAA